MLVLFEKETKPRLSSMFFFWAKTFFFFFFNFLYLQRTDTTVDGQQGRSESRSSQESFDP